MKNEHVNWEAIEEITKPIFEAIKQINKDHSHLRVKLSNDNGSLVLTSDLYLSIEVFRPLK